MKRLIIISLIAAMVVMQLIATNAQAASVPHFLNYQSLLYDEGGNLLPDGPANITFRIIDADGAVLFEEQQTVDVVYGAVSTLVGNGLDASGAPSGGVPISILTPGATRYLEVAVAGYSPESYLEIVSVPYAVYAEKALGAADESIGTSALAKKSITIDHLADSFVEDLVDAMSSGGLIATASDLSSLRSAYRSTSGATTIGVSSGFVYSGGSNIQVVLQDLDRAIQLRQAGVDAVGNALTLHESATSGVHGVGAGQVVGTTLSQTLSNKTYQGSLSNTSGNHNGTWNSKTAPSGAIVGTTDVQTLTNKTISSPSINGTATISGFVNFNSATRSTWPGFRNVYRVANTVSIPVDRSTSPDCSVDFTNPDLYFCHSSASCTSGDALLGCSGYYNSVCWGDWACQYLGTRSPSSLECRAEIAVKGLDQTSYLTVYSFCGEPY